MHEEYGLPSDGDFGLGLAVCREQLAIELNDPGGEGGDCIWRGYVEGEGVGLIVSKMMITVAGCSG